MQATEAANDLAKYSKCLGDLSIKGESAGMVVDSINVQPFSRFGRQKTTNHNPIRQRGTCSRLLAYGLGMGYGNLPLALYRTRPGWRPHSLLAQINVS